jgi:endonuclease/exonuclease/phosphatase family metal-dependent hydrolase
MIMKISTSSRLFLLTVSCIVCCGSSLSAQDISINVLTYNIRFANPGDAPNTWKARKDNVLALIHQAKPDVFGLQEALKEQVTDVEISFPAFARIGVGRDDGKEAGEYSPLFYDTIKYNLLNSNTFWLSQTPGIAGSRGWDAACNRVVTWIRLKEKQSGKIFLVFCTHFDHMGEIARRNSAKFLLHAVDSLSGTDPAIIVGDFNADPVSEPYLLITDKSNPERLTDSRELCLKPKGTEYTFTGFQVAGLPGGRIDYVFLKGISEVDTYLTNPANNGEYYPSDHLPVSVTLRIN